ncbi:O-antigen translocase [Tamlana sp. 62-3]|uniref:O-antigen translocase n=1 Tax=Neotamlana sargassicola TaxID=2883125 RepID=A0A9X1I8S2_9FLAO|nr:O-antigen translocase [Tamlana sargassicola]MCB4808900.1 O-antigen translocase [Tamlana sargassicola]
MRKLIAYINDKVLVKIASLQMVSIITRIIAGLLTSKAIAVMVGPFGLALIGNLRNFVAAFQTIATQGLYKGVVQYISVFKENAKSLTKTLSTAYYFGFISTIIVACFCYFASEWINAIIFPSYNDYGYIIKIFAIALPFYALNMFSFSIMNGFSKYKILIIINIIGQILSVSIALILIYQEKLKGALISVVIAESIIFLITLVGIINRRSMLPNIQVKAVSFKMYKKMSSYAVMALFPAVLLPLVTIAIRSYIIDNVGYKEAGFWEAITRLSKYYLMFVSSLISLYLLPRFSEIKTTKAFKKEVWHFYKTIVPFLTLGLVLIFLLKKYIILAVFTEEFLPVEDLFFWQLLGDFIKVLSIIIAYQFLAKKMFWHYVLTEAFLIVILYITSVYFVNLLGGVKGVVVAHFVSYAMYYGMILLIFSSSFFGLDNDNIEEL